MPRWPGFFLQRFLPAHYLSKESLDSVKLGAGLIATMAALILGLLVSSSKGTYDRVNVLINEAAANAINLNQTLKNYGPEADPLRQILVDRISRIGNDIWPEISKGATKSSEAFKQKSSLDRNMADHLVDHLPDFRLRSFFAVQSHRHHGPVFLLPEHCRGDFPDLRDEYASGRLDQGAESTVPDGP